MLRKDRTRSETASESAAEVCGCPVGWILWPAVSGWPDSRSPRRGGAAESDREGLSAKGPKSGETMLDPSNPAQRLQEWRNSTSRTQLGSVQKRAKLGIIWETLVSENQNGRRMKLSVPQPLGAYLLEERIAFGGMAEVFRGTTKSSAFKKTVCIKRILPHLASDPNFVTMFRDEAAMVAQLGHANIVHVFDFGVEDGSPYLVMEYIDGLDLKSLLKLSKDKSRPLSVLDVLTIGKDICAGLHHVHTATDHSGRAMGLVHRDI